MNHIRSNDIPATNKLENIQLCTNTSQINDGRGGDFMTEGELGHHECFVQMFGGCINGLIGDGASWYA